MVVARRAQGVRSDSLLLRARSCRWPRPGEGRRGGGEGRAGGRADGIGSPWGRLFTSLVDMR